MNRRILVCLLIFFPFFAYSQQQYKHPSTLGIHFVELDFQNKTPLGNPVEMDPGIAINFLQGLNNHFDYTINIAGSFPDSISNHNTPDGKKHLLLQGDASIRTRMFGKTSTFNPFALTGIGFSGYSGKPGCYLLVGPGLQWNNKDVFLIVSTQYRPSLTQSLNNHFYYSLGIAGAISKPKKKQNLNTQVSPVVHVVVRDRDGDGLVDTADACPDVPGLLKFHGCPDSDNDGIEDSKDHCPFQFGYERYQGCPIPDTDKDGVNDEEDSCIYQPGPIQNHGCPLPNKKTDAVLKLAAKNIFFKTGSYELLPVSFPFLDTVVNILRQYPSAKIQIEGHTDDQGTPAANQLLSENRAKAVLEYFANKGINQLRMRARGFGQAMPVGTNKTAQGRANNRRVELKLE